MGNKGFKEDFTEIQCEEREYEFGTTFILEVKSSGNKQKWRFNGQKLDNASDLSFTKSNANFQDSGKYECIIDDKSKYVFNVKIYDFLFHNKFLGIRKSMIDKPTEEGKGIRKSMIHKPTEEGKGIRKSMIDKPTEEGKVIYKSMINKPTEEGKENQHQLKEYNMGSNPRGIAVIIVIDEFEIPKMNLKGMKTQDTARLRETFQNLHFKVMECTETKAADIHSYLQEVANKNHSVYDCFVLCFSTHGGNGFVCCSDFKRNDKNETEKGFILFTTLLELFLPAKCKSLAGKPKLFFFDCCRTVDETLDIGKHQSPIRMFHYERDQSAHYADILIGYATVAGGTTSLSNSGGSCYTNILTRCLNNHIANESLADVMVGVTNCMKEEYKLTPHHESTLTGKIVMKKLS